ncbi:MAG: hypothetical protein GY724_07695 [Actinomycetia bacterium]|nr:hypothetical protein [Actinomycetes bacterium]MCP5033182.1 hypothetical protein [Actinomycetes bacterium]
MPKQMAVLVVLVGLVVLAAGCGDDGATDETGTAEDGPQATEQESGGETPKECPTEPFAGELSRLALADLGHTDVALADGDLVDAAAFAIGAGYQYTVYVASFEIDDDDMGTTLEAPPDEVLVTFAARGVDGEEIEPGVVYDESFVIIDSGGGAENRPIDPTGTVEFIAFSDNHLCLKINFLDENQAMSGTVSARVTGGI